MPFNTLTTHAGLRIGPIVFETLVKHYFDSVKRDIQAGTSTNLRKDELLYDEAFNVIKAFLEASTQHTVEEVQGFSNTRIPSPPWVCVMRLLVPMTCCSDAAEYVIQALGGEAMARKIVGGIKWWQVRGINGVDAQWIATKKDWREAKRRYKMQEKTRNLNSPPGSPTVDEPESGLYDEDMDEMRCILYSHGGGYYFGSVDQERYSIQRYARKINGRVFAVNYRLSPQYPFPCALQDLVAAYLFLIRPPPGAAHRPVKPGHIIVSGDSAGGGLTLALLQVIRDTRLPAPAGAVLISPWCDLTHSFPSVHVNTATDIIPKYGLSLQKPSSLWPPPSDEMTCHVHASLRSRFLSALRNDESHRGPRPRTPANNERRRSTSVTMPVDVGATTSVPTLDTLDNPIISIVANNGETLAIDQQIHLYCPNNLIIHPLISPALSYLGGLPPLFIIASEKEVLRDEIIYTAHKAAYPNKYPVKEESRALYPPLAGIEGRFPATQVHLQVYDDAAHVLPVLFSFTTPAKFCFRAIASFCKHITGMNHPQSPIPSLPSVPSLPTNGQEREPEKHHIVESPQLIDTTSPGLPSSPTNGRTKAVASRSLSKSLSRTALSRSLSATVHRATSVVRRTHRTKSLTASEVKGAKVPTSTQSSQTDVGAPKFTHASASQPLQLARLAGDSIVYSDTIICPSWKETIIRERVSTKGVIRPLEDETELDAFKVPQDVVGGLSELAIRRYLEGRAKFDKKFAGAAKAVEKERQRQLERAKKDSIDSVKTIRSWLSREDSALLAGKKGIKEGLLATSGGWSWAWVIDGNERPPPSSIVARRDTQEARRLARIADLPLTDEESTLSANNLWSVVLNYLTVTPDKHRAASSSKEKQKSRSSHFFTYPPVEPTEPTTEVVH